MHILNLYIKTMEQRNIYLRQIKEEHKDEPIYCLPQSEAFVQSRLANQSVVAYNPRLPAALATSVLTHGVWKILKLKF